MNAEASYCFRQMTIKKAVEMLQVFGDLFIKDYHAIKRTFKCYAETLPYGEWL